MKNHYIRKGALLSFFCMAFVLLQAQTTYTEHLTKATDGKGKVVLLQDPDITDLINNVSTKAPASPIPGKTDKPGQHGAGALPPTSGKGGNAGNDGESPAYPVRRQRIRATGYRIQIFTGSNSHADKVKAFEIGEKCRKAFPMLAVYPRYYNPRWTCRVGDFKTQEEAQVYAKKIRAARLTGEVRIVKCEVLLQQPLSEE